jgi:hypothetical protein
LGHKNTQSTCEGNAQDKSKDVFSHDCSSFQDSSPKLRNSTMENPVKITRS